MDECEAEEQLGGRRAWQTLYQGEKLLILSTDSWSVEVFPLWKSARNHTSHSLGYVILKTLPSAHQPILPFHQRPTRFLRSPL